MKDILDKLQKPLAVSDIDFRIGATGKTQKGAWATVLAYKDARVDMRRLDECTDGLWQNEYHRDSKNVLQCSISIYSKDLQQWVTKVSNGTESASEAAKGEYSDAFKRAGFMWGIGRELYDMGEIFINLQENEYKDLGNGKIKCFANLRKWSFSLVDGKIVGKDNSGRERFKVDYGSTRVQGADVEEAPTKESPKKQEEKKEPTATERTNRMIAAINAAANKEAFDKVKSGVEQTLASASDKFTDNMKKKINDALESKAKTLK